MTASSDDKDALRVWSYNHPRRGLVAVAASTKREACVLFGITPYGAESKKQMLEQRPGFRLWDNAVGSPGRVVWRTESSDREDVDES